jgi:hypothetical protein
MKQKKHAEMTHDERVDEFWLYFHDYNNSEYTLVPLILAAGDFFDAVFGPERCNQGMSNLLGHNLAGDDPDKWREGLEDAQSAFLTEAFVGDLLQELSAYGQFGICLSAETADSEAMVADRLSKFLEQGASLLALCPLNDWLGKERSVDLEQTIMLALNRWELDHGQPVKPEALAIFGGVTIGRMRNIISGKTAELPKRSDGVPAKNALKWLDKKFEFYPSIWRTDRPDVREAAEHENITTIFDPLFVPKARDGSIFHPGLGRSGTFTVGEKGFEKDFPDFDSALEALQAMPSARWRRPGPNGGGWGLVTAVGWARFTRYELERIAISSEDEGSKS